MKRRSSTKEASVVRSSISSDETKAVVAAAGLTTIIGAMGEDTTPGVLDDERWSGVSSACVLDSCRNSGGTIHVRPCSGHP